MRPRPPRRGFTLIEMMVTLAVIVVLLIVAVPSFQALRQRSAIRSASEQVLGVWNQARLESAKQNTWVKFARGSSSGAHCVGAAIASSATDTTACDCFQTAATPTASYCNVARWPASNSTADQREWRGVTLADPTTAAALGTAIIEPKHAFLTTSAGGIAFVGPTSGPYAYKLYMMVDALGRGVLCQPTNATKKMSDYGTRGCNP